MELRRLKPLNYNVERRQKCKNSDGRESTALVFVSAHSKRAEKRHLIIESELFIPNGPSRNGQKNSYYKCSKATCKARAKISRHNLDKISIDNLEQREKCQVFVNNTHNHPTVGRQELRLGRGSQEEALTDDIEQAKSDESCDFEFVDAGLENQSSGTSRTDEIEEAKSDESCDLEFVDAGLENQSSSTSRTDEIDPLLCDVESPMPSGPFLSQMLDVHILSEDERENFEKMAHEAADLGTGPQNESYLDSLLVSPCPRYGRRLTTTVEIPKGAYIGSFYGRLCRKLPKNSIYSFKISKKNEKSLFVNAENEHDRPKLA